MRFEIWDLKSQISKTLTPALSQWERERKALSSREREKKALSNWERDIGQGVVDAGFGREYSQSSGAAEIAALA